MNHFIFSLQIRCAIEVLGRGAEKVSFLYLFLMIYQFNLFNNKHTFELMTH